MKLMERRQNYCNPATSEILILWGFVNVFGYLFLVSFWYVYFDGNLSSCRNGLYIRIQHLEYHFSIKYIRMIAMIPNDPYTDRHNIFYYERQCICFVWRHISNLKEYLPCKSLWPFINIRFCYYLHLFMFKTNQLVLHTIHYTMYIYDMTYWKQ